MIIKKTKFKGLLIIKQKNNTDKRGNLRETFNNKILKKSLFLNIVQHQRKMYLEVFIFKLKINSQNLSM